VGWELWERWGSPRLTYSAIADNPEGGQAGKRWWEVRWERWGASRTGRWWELWELWEGWELWEQWGAPDSLTRQLPTTPKGTSWKKMMEGAVGAVGCEPHGQMVGAVGAVGGVKRGKLCQNLGTLTKFIIF